MKARRSLGGGRLGFSFGCCAAIREKVIGGDAQTFTIRAVKYAPLMIVFNRIQILPTPNGRIADVSKSGQSRKASRKEFFRDMGDNIHNALKPHCVVYCQPHNVVFGEKK